MRLHYKTNWLILFREIVAIYFENNKQHIITLYGKNAVIIRVKGDNRCSNYCALKV
jgi:hypothetical protein